jgi:S-adenosylmethionine/arginine decarboxylase-like enzyme
MTATAAELAALDADPTWWGTHLVLNLGQCDPHVIRDPQEIVNIVDLLIEQLGMHTVGAPIVKHCGEGTRVGWTVVRIITTSNIVVHANDDDRSAFIDVFSCRPYDPAAAASFLIDAFGATHHTSSVLHRHIPT